MEISEKIKSIHKEVTLWRQKLHSNPELAYEENWTSNFIIEKLKSFNVEVHKGIGKTGVVGVLKGVKNNSSLGNRSLALRADMDALPIKEENNLSYKSIVEGKNACLWT